MSSWKLKLCRVTLALLLLCCLSGCSFAIRKEADESGISTTRYLLSFYSAKEDRDRKMGQGERWAK